VVYEPSISKGVEDEGGCSREGERQKKGRHAFQVECIVGWSLDPEIIGILGP
jgi:hypothetical protein